MSSILNHPTLPTGLISYLELEGNGTDATPNGNNCTLYGTPVTEPGKIGDGIYFDADSPHTWGQFVDEVLFNSLTSISVSAWVNADAGFGDNGIVFSRARYPYGTGTTGSAWQLYANESGGTWAFMVADSASNRVYALGGTLEASKWVHLVGTYNAGTNKVSIYTDGELNQELDGPVGGMNIPTDTGIFIATKHGYINHWGGVLDEIGIWNRAITADEVTALYNSNRGLSYGSLVGRVNLLVPKKAEAQGDSIVPTPTLIQLGPCTIGPVASSIRRGRLNIKMPRRK